MWTHPKPVTVWLKNEINPKQQQFWTCRDGRREFCWKFSLKNPPIYQPSSFQITQKLKEIAGQIATAEISDRPPLIQALSALASEEQGYFISFCLHTFYTWVCAVYMWLKRAFFFRRKPQNHPGNLQDYYNYVDQISRSFLAKSHQRADSDAAEAPTGANTWGLQCRIQGTDYQGAAKRTASQGQSSGCHRLGLECSNCCRQ